VTDHDSGTPEHTESQHIEVKDGDETVADADVSVSPEHVKTARASLRTASGHIAPGSRRDLVDAVMDLPAVQESSRLEAAIPVGDGELLDRLRERADDVTTRPAGATVLVDGNVPPGSGSESGQEEEPDGEPPAER
jgi:hypothetical protein